MASNLSKNRENAFNCQARRCFYCGYHMWLSDSEAFAAAAGLSKKQALQLRCTAEHLNARCDGGGNASFNIVAACLFCNRRRHMRPEALDPKQYKSLVTKRLAKGKWHSAALTAAR